LFGSGVGTLLSKPNDGLDIYIIALT